MVNADCSKGRPESARAYSRAPAMDDAQFRQWRELLESRTGMTLSPERRSYLEANLAIRMRELGCEDYQAYYEKVMYGPGAIVEWTTLVDRLTVQETRFFRDEEAFSLIREDVRERLRQGQSKALEAWSVGCSTGEEAYTLAMILEDCVREQPRPCYYAVTGTDISLEALEKARAARYGPRKLVTTSEEVRERYFQPAQKGELEVVPAIRDRVCFSQLNVLKLNKAPMHGMDIILCENVLIYFRRWRRREIASRLAERLASGGLLVLGQGELTDWQHPDLERVRSGQAQAWRRRSHSNE